MIPTRQVDKGAALATQLDILGVRYNPSRMSWQSVSCPNTMGHQHGDKTPSARINLTNGGYACHGCGITGDVYTLVMELQGVGFKEAVASIGQPVVVGNTGYLI